MAPKKETGLAPLRDPFARLRQMAAELNRIFDAPSWPAFRWPSAQLLPDSK